MDERTNAAPDSINPKADRHVVFARWLVDTYGKERLGAGTGVIDVAGGNGAISRTLTELGVRSTLLDPNRRCYNHGGISKGNDETYGIERGDVDALPIHTSCEDELGRVIRKCSLVCGLYPDQATEPIVDWRCGRMSRSR